MNLGQVFAGLKTLIYDLGRQGAALVTPPIALKVVGEDQPATMAPVATGVLLTCDIESIDSVGRDEHRSRYDAVNDLYLTDVYGNRKMTVEIRGESQNLTNAGMIYPVLENVRTRIKSPSALERVNALGLSIESISAVRKEPQVFDQRMLSVAVFTITFNVAVLYEDTPVTTIDKVNVTPGVIE